MEGEHADTPEAGNESESTAAEQVDGTLDEDDLGERADVVMVTGATSGVGRAVAREFGDDGAHVGLLARDEEALDDAKAEVEERGGEAVALPADVADPGQVESAAERLEAEFGPLDVWVNDAMTTVFAPATEIGDDEFERATEVTYLGFVYGTRAALKRMKPRDHGTVVQVGSALSYRGIPLQSAYCGAKFAARGFTESVRTELLHEDSDVDLTMVQLPGVNTPQFEHCRTKMPDQPRPMAPVFEPSVAADAVHWAAYNDRREVYVGRSTVKTVWGNKVAPWLVDRLLARSGYDGQQVEDEPVDDDRPDNLFEPVTGDRGARGPFGDEAHPSSPQLWLTKHREEVGGVAAVLVAALLAVLFGD